MLAQRLSLLEHADIDLGAVSLGELGQLDRAREAGRPRPDDEHVQLHAVARAFGALL